MKFKNQSLEELFKAADHFEKNATSWELYGYEFDHVKRKLIYKIKVPESKNILNVPGDIIFYRGRWLEMFKAKDIRAMSLLEAENIILNDRAELQKLRESACDS